MKAAAGLAAVLGLGLVLASCASGPSATETAACAPILKVTLPPGAGGATEGMGEAIALPTKLVDNLIRSGDPTLTRYGRTMTNPGIGVGFVKAFIGARTECRKIGAG
jgi:hypothetical protein